MENPMHMDGRGKNDARLDHPKSFVLKTGDIFWGIGDGYKSDISGDII